MVRSCYSVDCRFYVDGPVSRIRYYFVPPTNAILTSLNRFFPSTEFGNEVDNGANPGELKTRRQYDRGTNELPELDGSHPAGSPTDFAGLSLWPGAPPPPPDCYNVPGARLGLSVAVAWQSGFGVPTLARLGLSVGASVTTAQLQRLRVQWSFRSLVTPNSFRAAKVRALCRLNARAIVLSKRSSSVRQLDRLASTGFVLPRRFGLAAELVRLGHLAAPITRPAGQVVDYVLGASAVVLAKRGASVIGNFVVSSHAQAVAKRTGGPFRVEFNLAPAPPTEGSGALKFVLSHAVPALPARFGSLVIKCRTLNTAS